MEFGISDRGDRKTAVNGVEVGPIPREYPVKAVLF